MWTQVKGSNDSLLSVEKQECSTAAQKGVRQSVLIPTSHKHDKSLHFSLLKERGDPTMTDQQQQPTESAEASTNEIGIITTEQ